MQLPEFLTKLDDAIRNLENTNPEDRADLSYDEGFYEALKWVRAELKDVTTRQFPQVLQVSNVKGNLTITRR